MAPSLFTLNDGFKIPSVGLGCWMGYPGGGDACHKMVTTAIKLGYRHLDTAAGYGNEENVGLAVKESGIPRSEFFITTKLANGDHGRVNEAFEESLKKLGCEYIDLYLMHWPQAQRADGSIPSPEESPTFVETWQAMEQLAATGKVRGIGVSNFSIKTLEVLLAQSTIVPSVNQVQLHPCLPQHDLLEYCKTKGIHLTAWSPLGQVDSPLYSDETMKKVAEKNGITVAQVLLSWGVQRGTSVVPKSEREERLRNNFETVTLSDEDMKLVDNLHKNPGMHRQLFVGPAATKGVAGAFGWTYEQLGWKLDEDGNAFD